MTRALHAHGHRRLHDLEALGLADRRQVLRWMAGASLLPLIGCGDDGGGGDPNCSIIPTETGGPYPGDGSNGPNALSSSGIVRSDIRSSFGAMSGAAAGVPLTVELTLVDSNAACAALAGYAVYLWHCDRDGAYSLYGVPDQNYLRGVQAADASGKLSFGTIFPAAYSGRWPHIHFEIFPTLADASSASGSIKTSQLALPEDACNLVYAAAGYEQSVSRLAGSSLSSDMVFKDGVETQLATVSGNAADGFLAKLTVGVGA